MDKLINNTISENIKTYLTPIEIALRIDEESRTTAKKLYEFLELEPKNYSRWCNKNISENGFAIENEDYKVFVIKEENPQCGRPSQDYKLSASFAKKLAMGTHNEKGEAAKKYFIKVEEKLKEVATKSKQLGPMDQLRLQYQVLEQHEEKLVEVEHKVNTLENNMTIDHGQACNIKLAVDLRVRKLCCGNESAAYQNKNLRSKVYRFIWKSIKDYFEVTAYHNLLRKDIDKVTNYINNLTLQGRLLRGVQETNNQMCFKQEA